MAESDVVEEAAHASSDAHATSSSSSFFVSQTGLQPTISDDKHFREEAGVAAPPGVCISNEQSGRWRNKSGKKHKLQNHENSKHIAALADRRLEFRTWLFDSGASLDLVAFDTVAKNELVKCSPQPINTANGQVSCKYRAKLKLHSLKENINPLAALGHSPNLLSAGLRCQRWGYG